MSIYIMTVGELAKKRGQPVGDFVKRVQELGFDAGSHAKKLTQADLDLLIGLLDGTSSNENKAPQEKEDKKLDNPNVLLIKLDKGKHLVALVDASVDSNGEIQIQVVRQSTESSTGEALLEFRKNMGMHMGVN